MRVDFKGRLFVPGEERESACSIVDMSPSGAQVVCEAAPPPNTPVVVYIDGFGRFEAFRQDFRQARDRPALET